MKKEEFFTLLNMHITAKLFQSYKDGDKTLKDILDILEEQITTCLRLQYEDGYAKGYKEAYDDGYEDGYDEGEKEGFVEGRSAKRKNESSQSHLR